MKINEMFASIQGEGRYIGHPAFFIRLSGCTRACKFCDTKYHVVGKGIGYEEIVNAIRKSNLKTIVWTGGEPLLQRDSIFDIMNILGKGYAHHLETNGDLLAKTDLHAFTYIACSPKDKKSAKKAHKLFHREHYYTDIKVVTDLKLNKDIIKYATMLMPLTIDRDGPVDKEIKKKVWDYCVKHNIRYCPRIHVDVWGNKKGV